MVDPAIDNAGRRLDQFLTESIAALKAKDPAVEEPQTTEQTQSPKGSPEEVAAWNAAREKLPMAPTVKPKASGVNPFKLLGDKINAGMADHNARARKLSERWDGLNERAGSAFTKAESKVEEREAGMDAFEASLEHIEAIGNEDPN